MKKLSLVSVIFLVLFALGFWWRIFLMQFPGYIRDIDVMRIWAQTVTNHGIIQFYDFDIYHEYPPGILYLLKFFQPLYHVFTQQNIPLQLDQSFSQFYKGLLIFFDLLLAGLVGLLVGKVSKKKNLAFITTLLVWLNPALWYDSVYWGQIDMLLGLGILASFLLFYTNQWFLGGLVLMVTGLTKLQATILIPWFFILSISINWRHNLLRLITGLLTGAILVFLPYILAGNLDKIALIVWQTQNVFPYFSLNAFNLWWLIGGGEPWPLDNLPVLMGISANMLGKVCFAFSYLAMIIWYVKQQIRDNKQRIVVGLFGAGMISLCAYLLLTQMHERYLYLPVLLFTVLWFLWNRQQKLFCWLTVILSLIFLFNLAFVMNRVYYRDIIGRTFPFLLNLAFSFIVSFVYIILAGGYLYCMKFIYDKLGKQSSVKYAKTTGFWSLVRTDQLTVKEVKLKNSNLFLTLILIFSLVVRLWNIWYPKAYIFDEVYHGFTAQEMAKGNKMAWQWWNISPPGFAYEWTHPPLAKMFMAVGVWLFKAYDQTSQYAFRLPAALFGVGAIYLTYLLAKTVFKNERLGLLAAFLLSLDGLTFVMSRVGMADIYALFFLLLTIYLALKDRFFWSAVSLGLAVGTKWTGVYLYPVVGIILIGKLVDIANKHKRTVGTWLNRYIAIWLIEFIIIPPIIYLLCNLPFFLTGHNWSQFVELQKQMWWYHTNLKATHGYQSQAWSWPFMLRPVWFWVDYKPNTLANIYNFGNPILWWGGLMILPLAIYNFLDDLWHKKPFHRMGFIIICYFAFWLPWVVSPRIMFLHHYLPAIPFLCIIIAWFMNKIYDSKFKINDQIIRGKWVVALCLLLFAGSFIFFYPIYTGLAVPKDLVKIFFWLPSWK